MPQLHSIYQPTNELNTIHDKHETATRFGTEMPSSGSLLGGKKRIQIKRGDPGAYRPN